VNLSFDITNQKGKCDREWAGFDGCPVVLADDNEGYCQTDEHVLVS